MNHLAGSRVFQSGRTKGAAAALLSNHLSRRTSLLTRGSVPPALRTMSTASLHLVPVPLPENTNVILGQSHFIKTCEDIYEACQSVGGGIKFGLAFSEASGDCLVRSEGTDDDLVKVAETFMYEKLRCGHTFAVWIRSPHFPINVLNAIKNVPEVREIKLNAAILFQ